MISFGLMVLRSNLERQMRRRLMRRFLNIIGDLSDLIKLQLGSYMFPPYVKVEKGEHDCEHFLDEGGSR